MKNLILSILAMSFNMSALGGLWIDDASREVEDRVL